MRNLILFVLSLTLLSACGPVRDAGETQADPEQTARQFMQTGDYFAAAEEYLALAEQNPRNAATYRLKATAAFVEGGEYDRAFQILNDTSVAEDDALQNLRRRILSARLELEFGQPGKAIDQLSAMNVAELPTGLRATYHDILSRAHLARADYLNAINQRQLAKQYLSTDTQLAQHYKSLWQIFETMPESDLDDLRLAASDDLVSWFDLASLYRTYRFQPEKLDFAIDGWVQRYPGHPAFTAIVPQLRDQVTQYVQRPQKIGLLLPFSSQYKKASAAIRDGFLAAWYMESQGQPKPDVVIYDANALNIVEAYQQAITDGVEYVVGPLEKEAIDALLNYGELPVPVLALNRQDSGSEVRNSQMIQFALAPEDEAKQIAEAAMSDGHTLALVITPDNDWGKRVADNFKQRWIELGGAVLEHSFYSSQQKDYATPVKAMLNIDSSQIRTQELRNKLRLKINSVERRRQDADFIFTAAVPGDARQLLPQIRFYRAGDLPIYSTSHIFGGVVDSARDTDMNDVMFIDMPWILDTRRQLSLIQDALNRNWSQDKSNFRRLYAMGIDAYRLIPEINRLRLEQNSFLSGETGDLKLDNNNIVHRTLRRAQFVEGKPVLLN